MSKINWKVRLKNKAFWVFIIPAIIMLIQTVAEVFGYSLDLSGIGEKLINVVEALFVVLIGIGIVNDPTTEGVTDSERALLYDTPAKSK